MILDELQLQVHFFKNIKFYLKNNNNIQSYLCENYLYKIHEFQIKV